MIFESFSLINWKVWIVLIITTSLGNFLIFNQSNWCIFFFKIWLWFYDTVKMNSSSFHIFHFIGLWKSPFDYWILFGILWVDWRNYLIMFAILFRARNNQLQLQPQHGMKRKPQRTTPKNNIFYLKYRKARFNFVWPIHLHIQQQKKTWKKEGLHDND